MKMTEIKRREYDRIDEKNRMAGLVVAIFSGLATALMIYLSLDILK